jgi:hypothetical protein
LILILLAGAVWASDATVVVWGASVADTPGGKTVARLPAGVLVTEEKRENGYSRVSFRGIKGWTRQDNLRVYDGRLDDMRERTVLAQGIPSEGGKYYIYYWVDGKIRKYSVADRFAEAAQRCAPVSEIRFSPRSDMLLLEGVTTNGGAAHHLALFQFPTGKTTLLASFPEGDNAIEGTMFSKNGAYLAVIFRASEQRSLAVYRTDTGDYVGGVKDISGAAWSSQNLVLYDRSRIWIVPALDKSGLADYSWTKESHLTNIREEWLNDGELQISANPEDVAIASTSGVFRIQLSTRQVIRTQYKGLLVSDDGALNFSLRGGVPSLRLTASDQPFEEYSGAEPKSEFLRFCGTNFIAKKKYDKLDSLFLVNSKGEEVYRYRSIDQAEAASDNGILAEQETDKDISLIVIEDPWKGQFYVILDKEGK